MCRDIARSCLPLLIQDCEQSKEKKKECRPRKLRKVPFLYPLPVSPDPRAFFQQRQIFHSSVVPLPPGARLGSRVARLFLSESMQRSAYRVLTQCRAATKDSSKQQPLVGGARRFIVFLSLFYFKCRELVLVARFNGKTGLQVRREQVCVCVCVCQTYVCFVHRMKGTCSSLLFP